MVAAPLASFGGGRVTRLQPLPQYPVETGYIVGGS
jgi:hypothetical protein